MKLTFPLVANHYLDEISSNSITLSLQAIISNYIRLDIISTLLLLLNSYDN